MPEEWPLSHEPISVNEHTTSRNELGDDSTSSGLLRRVAGGDQQAWDELVNRYGPVVYAFARQKGVSPSDAIDVVQEVFLGYAVQAATFDHVSFRGWLRGCVGHKAADHFRRLGKQPIAVGGSTFMRFLTQLPEHEQLEPDSDDEYDRTEPGTTHNNPPSQTPASSPDLLGVIDATDSLPLSKEIAAVVDQVRRRTSERCWLALWRVVMEGRDSRDVAEEAGMKLGALHECLSRTRRRLRNALATLSPALAPESAPPSEKPLQ
jgi:RNA polymerase sigma-70 factor (ECF subfamily)